MMSLKTCARTEFAFNFRASGMEGTSIVFRPVEKHEQQQVLDLWCRIFGAKPGFYERYFCPKASPLYQEGDTLGAWDKDQLVSTVYIRRFHLRSSEENRQYRCGGIGNVATLPDYRRQGLSRHLLRMALAKMEQSEEFDLSFLGTEKHQHYLPLGWESISEPTAVHLDWKTLPKPDTGLEWRSASDVLLNDIERMSNIHSEQPRLYQVERSPATIFQYWVKWEWENDEAIVYLEEDQGYIVIGKIESEQDVSILEWRAPNIAVEQTLLSLAVSEIRRRHDAATTIRLFALPQYMTMAELAEWAGPVQHGSNPESMVRNIRLSVDTYSRIKEAFSNGQATFWSGDFFWFSSHEIVAQSTVPCKSPYRRDVSYGSKSINHIWVICNTYLLSVVLFPFLSQSAWQVLEATRTTPTVQTVISCAFQSILIYECPPRFRFGECNSKKEHTTDRYQWTNRFVRRRFFFNHYIKSDSSRRSDLRGTRRGTESWGRSSKICEQ